MFAMWISRNLFSIERLRIDLTETYGLNLRIFWLDRAGFPRLPALLGAESGSLRQRVDLATPFEK